MNGPEESHVFMSFEQELCNQQILCMLLNENEQEEEDSVPLQFEFLDALLESHTMMEQQISPLLQPHVNKPMCSSSAANPLQTIQLVDENCQMVACSTSRKRKRNFTAEELNEIQNQMKKPKAKYNRGVQTPFQSMCHVFKFK